MNKNKRYPALFMAPGVLIYGVFFILPVLIGVWYSFTNWNFTRADFVGLMNYKNIISDPSIKRALLNTIIFTVVTTVGKVGLGLALAVFLNRKLHLRNYLRGISFFPAIISTVAVGIVFTAILHPYGLLNQFFRALGLDFMAKNWLTDTKLALLSVCGVEIWKWSGFNMVIILAGLQAVPPEYQEAATIDGANAWQRFWRVTFPLILPAFNNAFVNSLIGGLKVFDIIVATTNGGPGVTTQVMNTMIYRSFSFNMQGEANAGYVLLAVIVALFAVSSYSIIRKREVKKKWKSIAAELVALLVSAIFVVPIWMIFVNSLKDSKHANQLSLALTGVNLKQAAQNYAEVFRVSGLTTAYLNSTIITVLSVALIVLTASMAAFIIQRRKQKWVGRVNSLIILGMTMPGFTVPTYFLLKSLGLLHTYLGICLVYTASFFPLAVFIFTGYFRSIPDELDESALLDGCTPMQMYWKIILPLIKPVMVTVIIIAGMSIWNLLFANITLISLPIIAIYCFLQKYIVSGMTAGAVKG